MRRIDVGCEQWGWNLVDGVALHRIREKLGNYETMTFREILNKDATGCHDVETHRLCPDARKRLSVLGLDIDSLFSLRITGEERVGHSDRACGRSVLVGPRPPGLPIEQEEHLAAAARKFSSLPENRPVDGHSRAKPLCPRRTRATFEGPNFFNSG